MRGVFGEHIIYPHAVACLAPDDGAHRKRNMDVKMMPEKKERKADTPAQKWRMSLTDSANFAEKMVDADMTAMTTAWESDKKTEPAPVWLTRDEYAAAADAHRAIAAACAARDDAVGTAQHDRHMAVADRMCDIATAAWTPAKAHDAAVAAAAAAKEKADAVAKVAAMMAQLGLTADDINQ